jgi:predicted 3-demethylubiquinone-9 3-methyltransferase (glyoxalase superfamily)
LNIVKIKVEDLIPYINNPRNNENAVDKVASSIAEFGFKNPIVIDKNNVVINGHTRLLASKKLGLKEVPVIIADDLTEAQVKAFRIADNKVSEYASWDEELLKIELEQLEEMNFNLNDLNIDYSDFGLEIDYIEDDFIEIKEREDLSDKVNSAYEIIIECDNEEEQEEMYNRFIEEGLRCRVLTL